MCQEWGGGCVCVKNGVGDVCVDLKMGWDGRCVC